MSDIERCLNCGDVVTDDGCACPAMRQPTPSPLTREQVKEWMYRHQEASIARQRYRETSKTLDRQFAYDAELHGLEENLLAHDAALRLAITQQAQEIESMKDRLDKYAHWTPEHTIEEWLADRQRIVDAKQVAADAQLQATLAAREAVIARQEATIRGYRHSFKIVGQQHDDRKAERDAAVQRAEQAEARVKELEGEA